jgi:hypothetical protein
MINWVPSLEELAADPGYASAPVIGIQTDDFATLPGSITEPLMDRGFAIQTINGTKPSVEEMSNVNTYNNGIFSKPEESASKPGQVATLVSKWPTDVEIPAGGVVIANGVDDDGLAQIKDAGYELHTSGESYAASLVK